MAALYTIIILIILLVVNVLLGDTGLKIDLTPRKLFSLTDETRNLLEGLEQEVEILALYKAGEEPEGIMENLNAYDKLSPLLNVRIVDPDRNPNIVARYAQENEAAGPDHLIVISGDLFRIIGSEDLYEIVYNQQGHSQVVGQKIEQQISSAIAYVSSGRILKIYEITGHKETPLTLLGYGDLLKGANFETGELSLVVSNIPEDADMLTIIGPVSDFSKAEIEKLQIYMEAGGGLFIALDYTTTPLSVLNEFLSRWDIVVRHGLLMEKSRNRLIAEFGDNPFVSAPIMAVHEVMDPLNQSRLNPIFQASLGFRRTRTQQNRLEYVSLLHSSGQSILRTDLSIEDALQAEQYPGDEAGPVDVAVAVRERNPGTNEGAVLIALGSAATLRGIGYLGQVKANADLVLNLLKWAVNDDVTVDIPVKSLFKSPLRISNTMGLIYAFITILLLPILSISIGLIIWRHRRNR